MHRFPCIMFYLARGQAGAIRDSRQPTQVGKNIIFQNITLGLLQYLPKFFGTAARTYLVGWRTWGGARIFTMLDIARHAGFAREVLKICDRDCNNVLQKK